MPGGPRTFGTRMTQIPPSPVRSQLTHSPSCLAEVLRKRLGPTAVPRPADEQDRRRTSHTVPIITVQVTRLRPPACLPAPEPKTLGPLPHATPRTRCTQNAESSLCRAVPCRCARVVTSPSPWAPTRRRHESPVPVPSQQMNAAGRSRHSHPVSDATRALPKLENHPYAGDDQRPVDHPDQNVPLSV